MPYTCDICDYEGETFNVFQNHYIRRHQNDPNFHVRCTIGACGYSTKKWSSFRVHVHRSLLQDVPADKILQALQTKTGEPLHVVIMTDCNGGLESQHIVGDGCRISVGVEGGVLAAVAHLLVAYYVFDIDYPKPYAMALGILQQLCLEEKYCNAFSQKACIFLKKIRSAYDSVPADHEALKPLVEV